MSCQDFRFKKGSTHIFSAPSGGGKTWRVMQLIKHKNELIEDGSSISNVILFYSVWQDIYSDMMNQGLIQKCIRKMPTQSEFETLMKSHVHKGGSIAIFDDLLSEVNQELSKIVLVSSRHLNTTSILLFQTLFSPNKFYREISLNVKYIHLFLNCRDTCQIQYLLRQVLSKNTGWAVRAYMNQTSKPYKCFLIDLTQHCEPQYRFRGDYLPSEKPMLIFVEKGTINI